MSGIERVRTQRHGMVSIQRHQDGRYAFYSIAPEEVSRPEWRYRLWPVGRDHLTFKDARQDLTEQLEAWDTEAFDIVSHILLQQEVAA